SAPALASRTRPAPRPSPGLALDPRRPLGAPAGGARLGGDLEGRADRPGRRAVLLLRVRAVPDAALPHDARWPGPGAPPYGPASPPAAGRPPARGGPAAGSDTRGDPAGRRRRSPVGRGRGGPLGR